MLAGRRCHCRGWHSDHLIVHHQWEYSWLCARSSSKVPNAPMGNSRFARCLQGGEVRATETLKSSHRPEERLTFCSLFAGRRCLRRRWLSDHLIVHHQWELSWQCACSCSKVPIGLCWDVLLTRLLRLSLAKLRMLRSTTGCTCRSDFQKFPLP